ncbi:hypothetical protein VPH35_108566 [Triticum aestivum]
MIKGYFGRRLPLWMMSSSDVPLNSLRILFIEDLASCTQLPDGLCQLLYLEVLSGQTCSSHQARWTRIHAVLPSTQSSSFPDGGCISKIARDAFSWDGRMGGVGVGEASASLSCLAETCAIKLQIEVSSSWPCFPGKDLNTLSLQYVHGLVSLENFPLLVELNLFENLDLERITNFSRLKKLAIHHCSNLKVLEGVPALQRFMLTDILMEALPEYMGGINPRLLELYCSLALLTSIAAGQSGPEWDKFSHVEHVKAYAREGGNSRKWYVFYTVKPYSLETNVSLSFVSRAW